MVSIKHKLENQRRIINSIIIQDKILAKSITVESR